MRVSNGLPYYNTSLNTADDTSSLHNISFSFLQMLQAPKAPLCKGGWQKSLISDWGIVLVDTLQSFRHGYRRATSLYTREALRPTIILQITLLVSVKARRLYRNKKKNEPTLTSKKGRFISFEILRR